MSQSAASSVAELAPLEKPGWKTAVSWVAAVFISLVFLIAGLWKVTDPTGAAVRLAQAKVPENLSLLAALLLGTSETFAGVLLLVPRFRKWGAWLGSLLLLAFMIYIGIHYNELRGAECSCFPWVKRAVGPGFFVGDALMVLVAVIAGIWARQSENLRGAALILAAVAVFAGVSFGVAATRQTGTKAPETITVDGKPYSLREGKVFVYFFDPECMHCLDAGRRMAKLNWGDTKIVGVATVQPQFAKSFMQDTGLRGGVSADLALLRKTFPFVSTPAGVAIENGREKGQLSRFEGEEPAATLRKLSLVY